MRRGTRVAVVGGLVLLSVALIACGATPTPELALYDPDNLPGKHLPGTRVSIQNISPSISVSLNPSLIVFAIYERGLEKETILITLADEGQIVELGEGIEVEHKASLGLLVPGDEDFSEGWHIILYVNKCLDPLDKFGKCCTEFLAHELYHVWARRNDPALNDDLHAVGYGWGVAEASDSHFGEQVCYEDYQAAASEYGVVPIDLEVWRAFEGLGSVWFWITEE